MAHEQKITVKIDVKKLVKSGFYQGEKGLYATLTIIPTPDNKYVLNQRERGDSRPPLYPPVSMCRKKFSIYHHIYLLYLTLPPYG